MYAGLIEMSLSPLISEPSSHGSAALELFSLNGATKQPDEENKKSGLTMTDAAAIEWMILERCVRCVLPGKFPYVQSLTRTGTGVQRDKQQ